MPSWQLFGRQPREYRDQVLPPAVRARVSVEAAGPMGWHQWVGADGEVIALTRFGESAPATRLFQELGFSAENVANKVRRTLGLGEVATKAEGGEESAGPARLGTDESHASAAAAR